jgi:glycosyltransferase involved in cell wall biosynthesis
MKRVLWVTAIEPRLDGGGGGEIRQAHLIDALADRFEVSLLLAGRLTDPRLRDRLAGVTEVQAPVAGDPPSRTARRLRDLRWQVLERQADEVARQKQLRQKLASSLAARRGGEIVCVEYIGLAPLLPAPRQGFWSLTLHNLPSEMARHNATIAPGRRQRLMLGLEERNARRLEHWAARAYDLVVAVSHEDAAALPAGAVVVPNGVDTDRFRASPVPAGHRVVFTGALHTLPNRDGLQWFCREVWPRVRARVPGATLDAVGSRPGQEVRALDGPDGIRVHADVPSILPFLERARVAVVPLRIGSGSRLKALEAMAAGRPIVGTTIGLGGLEAEPGVHALRADDAGDFAEAVIGCLNDDALAAALAGRGRRLADARYSWRQIGSDYAELLDERSETGRPSSTSDSTST